MLSRLYFALADNHLGCNMSGQKGRIMQPFRAKHGTGKSTYIRTIALMAVMAQAGSLYASGSQ